MSTARSLSGDSCWFQTRDVRENVRLSKFSPELIRRSKENPTSLTFNKSTSFSTCTSEDSGIERTLNLTPTSPLPGDTDSEDSTSLDGFRIPQRPVCQDQLLRPLTAKVYHDLPPVGRFNVAETAQFSPSGTCLAATRDPHQCSYSPYTTKATFIGSDNRFQILSYEQVDSLNKLLTEVIPIHSRYAGFPTIWVRLSELFQAVRENLLECGIPVRDIRLNGGAATYVIGEETSSSYNDVDVLISVDLSSHSSIIQRVKSAVLDALMRFIPHDHSLLSTSLTLPSNKFRGDIHAEKSEDSRNEIEKWNQIGSSKYFSTTIPSDDGRTRGHDESDENIFEASDITALTNHLDEPVDIVHGPTPLIAINDDFPQDISKSALHSNSTTLISTNPECLSHNKMHLSRIVETKNHPHLSNFSPNVYTTPINHSISPSDISLRESYIYKQFRKFSSHEADCWSLLSLGAPSANSKVIEFKFVDRMQRQFEFTIDSFQILLDSILSFIQINPSCKMTRNFYPTVVAESVACSFSVALHHLKHKLILTKEPEMIRGGGLLKYCRLLVNGYQAPQGIDVCSLERYMSSRFFIDFQDLESQKFKLQAFLANHFMENETEKKISFLKTVYQVVSGSTICLMSFERFQTLTLIIQMVQQLAMEYRTQQASFSLDCLVNQQNLTVDKIFFGTQLFPVISQADSVGVVCYQCEPQKPQSESAAFNCGVLTLESTTVAAE
ncbi:hypothetical protein EG68_00104 [Paragonimus skrjabini miyazakii]|uniref:polynucleotide adenylyltransferase n=1 Tax=Paragonimus skrjabini miyazakii TaxID=59628 RepID=A0A8S9ZCJ9_9TREM|nr:hypothetical protein EG68_00104 [Paragonimus skrjabini miyazakii]